MQVAILASRTGWHTDELCRALKQRGHTGHVVFYEQLVARLGRRLPHVHVDQSHPGLSALTSGAASLLDADAVLARIIPAGSLEQIIYRLDALHWIEERGIPVMNSPRAIERTVDKFYTDARLGEAGLPTPETVVCEGVDEAMAAVEQFGDAVIKPLFGSMGHGLVRVSDPDTAHRVIRALVQTRAVFYVQRIVSREGRDVRAFVVGGRVVAAIERRAAPHEWRSNVSRGGLATALDLPGPWASLACRAATAVGAEYAGVDLMPAADDTVFVLEVNGIPGWEGLQRATGVDVAGALIDHLTSRVTARSNACPELLP